MVFTIRHGAVVFSLWDLVMSVLYMASAILYHQNYIKNTTDTVWEEEIPILKIVCISWIPFDRTIIVFLHVRQLYLFYRDLLCPDCLAWMCIYLTISLLLNIILSLLLTPVLNKLIYIIWILLAVESYFLIIAPVYHKSITKYAKDIPRGKYFHLVHEN